MSKPATRREQGGMRHLEGLDSEGFSAFSETEHAVPDIVVDPPSTVPAVIVGPADAVQAAVVDPISTVPAVSTTPAVEVRNPVEMIGGGRAVKAKVAQDFVDKERREAAQQVTEQIEAERDLKEKDVKLRGNDGKTSKRLKMRGISDSLMQLMPILMV